MWQHSGSEGSVGSVGGAILAYLSIQQKRRWKWRWKWRWICSTELNDSTTEQYKLSEKPVKLQPRRSILTYFRDFEWGESLVRLNSSEKIKLAAEIRLFLASTSTPVPWWSTVFGCRPKILGFLGHCPRVHCGPDICFLPIFFYLVRERQS